MTELEREDNCVSTNSNNTEDSGLGSFTGSVRACEGAEGKQEITTSKQRRTKFPDIGVTNYTDGEEIITVLASLSYQGGGSGGITLLCLDRIILILNSV